MSEEVPRRLRSDLEIDLMLQEILRPITVKEDRMNLVNQMNRECRNDITPLNTGVNCHCPVVADDLLS